MPERYVDGKALVGHEIKNAGTLLSEQPVINVTDGITATIDGATVKITANTTYLSTIYWKLDQTTPQTVTGTPTFPNLECTDTGDSIFGEGVVANDFESTVVTGTAPYACVSETVNTHLNADMLDGYHSTSFLMNQEVDGGYAGSVYTLTQVIDGEGA